MPVAACRATQHLPDRLRRDVTDTDRPQAKRGWAGRNWGVTAPGCLRRGKGFPIGTRSNPGKEARRSFDEL